MTVEEVAALRAKGYNPWDYYHRTRNCGPWSTGSGPVFFTPGEGAAFAPVHHTLLSGGDPFMVLADFRAYSDAQAKVDAAYRDRDRWARMAILNVARSGRFSSDRTIREYAEEIWHLPQCRRAKNP